MIRKRQRIMIIGQPGSGKSTLARILGDRLNLPVFHIDHIHWQSGWIERSPQEKDRLCSRVHARQQWVFEGGRSATWRQRLDRADTLIWLDFPVSIRVWRVLRRTVRYYGRSRPDLPAGCPEQLSWEFIRWIWNTRISSRVKMRRLYDTTPEHKDKYRLTNRNEVKNFVATVQQ